MKNYLYSAIAACLVFSACNEHVETDCPANPLVPKFLSQTFFAGKEANSFAAEFGKSIQEQLVAQVVKGAKDGTLTVYDPLSEPWDKSLLMKLTQAEIDRKFAPFIDTMYVEHTEPPYDIDMIVNVNDGLDRNVSIRAYETWELGDSLRLSKHVSAYTLVAENRDPKTGEVRGLEPKLMVVGEFDQATKKKIATVRYAQQVVNADDYGDWYRFNLEHSVREKLFGQILTAADSNTVAFYAEPDINRVLKTEELYRKMSFIDTIYIESPNPPYDLQMHVIEERIYWGGISEIEFVQDVYVDANFNLFYDVRWYAPRLKLFDRTTGAALGVETLFWVKCF